MFQEFSIRYFGYHRTWNQAGATASSGGLASNYNLTSAALTINKKVLNSNSSRVYNATTTAAASDITLQTKYQVNLAIK